MVATNPKAIEKRIKRAMEAWQTLAPEKIFGGLTLTEFQTLLAAAIAARERIINLEQQLMTAINDRDKADKICLDKLQLIVNGVKGDPTEGVNSALYEAMGYIKKSDRKTGLTRKRIKREKPTEK